MTNIKLKPQYKFLMTFLIVMGFLAIIRHAFKPEIPSYDFQTSAMLPTEVTELPTEEMLAESKEESQVGTKVNVPEPESQTPSVEIVFESDSVRQAYDDSLRLDSIRKRNTPLFRESGKIWSYDECLPDTQEQHIAAARRLGIKPVATHQQVLDLAAADKLVSINQSPFYVVERLNYSMPYLVPSARNLLTRISLNFLDSLESKGQKPYLPIITSVLRTTDDVSKLTRNNSNATENSCHSYGTTFDITYSRFMPLTGIPTPTDSAEWIRGALKITLGEVLFDLRNEGCCFVKHEIKQPCFHITVR